MNAPTATATRGAAFLALALADALGLGLPDPDYITMNPDLAGSTTTSAADFQFNDLHGQDPLPAMQAWADRFGVTVGTRPGTGDPGITWHEFDFTHAGVRIHAYASIAAAQDEDEDDGGCVAPSPAGSACLRPAGHDLIGGTPHRDLNRRQWDDDGWTADAAAPETEDGR